MEQVSENNESYFFDLLPEMYGWNCLFLNVSFKKVGDTLEMNMSESKSWEIRKFKNDLILQTTTCADTSLQPFLTVCQKVLDLSRFISPGF